MLLLSRREKSKWTPAFAGVTRPAISSWAPFICPRKRITSSRHSTTGKHYGRFVRRMSCIHGRSVSSTSRYRNSSADEAWFCVDAAMFRPAPVRSEIPRPHAHAPLSRGWRVPLARMKCRVHPFDAVSVRNAEPECRTRARTSSRRRGALRAPTLARTRAGCEDSMAAGFLFERGPD